MSCIGRMFFIQILYSNWIWIYKELKCLLLVFFSHDFWVPLELARFVTIFLVLVSARNFHTGEPKKMALVRGLISIRLHWLVGAPLMTLGLLPVSRRCLRVTCADCAFGPALAFGLALCRLWADLFAQQDREHPSSTLRWLTGERSVKGVAWVNWWTITH